MTKDIIIEKMAREIGYYFNKPYAEYLPLAQAAYKASGIEELQKEVELLMQNSESQTQTQQALIKKLEIARRELRKHMSFKDIDELLTKIGG